MNFLFCSIYLTVFTGILAKMMNSPESSTTDAPPPRFPGLLVPHPTFRSNHCFSEDLTVYTSSPGWHGKGRREAAAVTTKQERRNGG